MDKSKCVAILVILVRIQISKCIMKPFMVGGDHAPITKYPHSVFLVLDCHGEASICGASILNQRVLLTAAHCIPPCDVVKNKDDTIDAYAGHENIHQATYVNSVIDTIVHDQYDSLSVANDVAVALVKKDIPLGRDAKRVIVLPKIQQAFQEGFVAGWGITDEERFTLTDTLKTVTQKIGSNKTCAKLGKLHPGMFCAGSEKKSDPHPSSGDSGCAMVIQESYEIGLVSFKIARLPALMVYTNVTYYYEWIRNNTLNIYCRNINKN